LLGAQTGVDSVIHGDRRGGIAPAKTRSLTNRNLIFGRAPECPFHGGAEFLGAPEMTRHVRANAHVEFRRSRKVEGRIKAGDGVNLADGELQL
jgi:hypothetical protein